MPIIKSFHHITSTITKPKDVTHLLCQDTFYIRRCFLSQSLQNEESKYTLSPGKFLDVT